VFRFLAVETRVLPLPLDSSGGLLGLLCELLGSLAMLLRQPRVPFGVLGLLRCLCLLYLAWSE
jgi:hypothetical protein